MWLFSLQTAGGTSTKLFWRRCCREGVSARATNSVMGRWMRACGVFLLPLHNFEQNFTLHHSSKAEGDWSDGGSQQCEASQRWPVICCHLFTGNAADWISGWTLGLVHKVDFLPFGQNTIGMSWSGIKTKEKGNKQNVNRKYTKIHLDIYKSASPERTEDDNGCLTSSLTDEWMLFSCPDHNVTRPIGKHGGGAINYHEVDKVSGDPEVALFFLLGGSSCL